MQNRVAVRTQTSIQAGTDPSDKFEMEVLENSAGESFVELALMRGSRDTVAIPDSCYKMTSNPLLDKFILFPSSYEEDADDLRCFHYEKSKPILQRHGKSWRKMQIAQPPITSLIVNPFVGNAACLFAEHYGGGWFDLACYHGVLIKKPSGLTFGHPIKTLNEIVRKHNGLLWLHRREGELIEHLEDFDDGEDVDDLDFHLLVPSS